VVIRQNVAVFVDDESGSKAGRLELSRALTEVPFEELVEGVVFTERTARCDDPSLDYLGGADIHHSGSQLLRQPDPEFSI